MRSITNSTELDQTMDVTQIMIDSRLVGTGMAFIESRFLCLQINVSGYNSVQPSSVLWHFYHHLHTVYFSDVLLQSIIYCVWNKCAQWNTL